MAGRHRPNTQVVYEDEDVIVFLNHFPTQDSYSLVCPKRHAERFEQDLSRSEWLHLQEVVQRVAAAVAEATPAIRMYLASLGSPERNAHLHVHVCPCPAGTPFERQQFEAMRRRDGLHHEADPDRQREVAQRIRAALEQPSIGDAHLLMRPIVEAEREWLAEKLQERWGSTSIVSRGVLHDAAALPALVCVRGTERVGMATFALADRACELVTLDAFERGRGVGSALLAAVVAAARGDGASRLWLITTNDNLDALRFYQRRGFRLGAVNRGAVDAARRLKPRSASAWTLRRQSWPAKTSTWTFSRRSPPATAMATR